MYGVWGGGGGGSLHVQSDLTYTHMHAVLDEISDIL